MSARKGLDRAAPGANALRALTLAFLLGCAFIGGLPARAQTPPRMYVSPATITVNADQPFDIEVTISSDRMMRGAQAALTFDPALVEATGWEEGTLFKTWAQANGASTQVGVQPVIDNVSGSISLAPVYIVGGRQDKGPTGTGSLFIYHLKAKPGACGQSDLKLENKLDQAHNPPWISNPDGENFTDLIITHGRVQVGAGECTNTPTPTPTPSATPSQTPSSATAETPTPTPTPSATPAGAAPSQTPTAATTGTPTPMGAMPTPASPLPTPTDTSCPTCPRMYVSPAMVKVNAGESFSITVVISSTGMMRGAEAGLMFDPGLLEATGWKEGSLFKDWAQANGASTQVGRQPVIDNMAGTISLAPVYIVGGQRTDRGPTGAGSLLIYELKARPNVSGQSVLTLTGEFGRTPGKVAISDPEGELLPNLIVTHGRVQIGQEGVYLLVPTTQPTATPDAFANTLSNYASVGADDWRVPWDLILVLGGTVVVVFGANLTVTLLNRGALPSRLPAPKELFSDVRTFLPRLLNQWPRWISTALALVPLVMLLFVISGLVIQSQLALRTVGPGRLLGGDSRSYGLLPSLWGTVLVSVIALVGAVPISLALAILATDFSFGPLSQVINAILGALAGIPPIVYALVATLLVSRVFMQPKFSGTEIPDISVDWPPPDLWSFVRAGGVSTERTLLGGIVLCLLIVPFIAPLIIDAIRNVPRDLREASWGLGANRWYTLTRVVLRSALPGISSAVVLGLLKVVGDVMIPVFAIGSVAFPSRLTDIMADPIKGLLSRVAPLTSTAAGLTGAGGDPVTKTSVAFFSGLLLLLLAVPLIALVTWLQTRLRRRLGA